MGQVVVVGLDIAKSVFQVHGVDRKLHASPPSAQLNRACLRFARAHGYLPRHGPELLAAEAAGSQPPARQGIVDTVDRMELDRVRKRALP
jgi:hypothetical protein